MCVSFCERYVKPAGALCSKLGLTLLNVQVPLLLLASETDMTISISVPHRELMEPWGTVPERRLTRSFSRGPAEHDEGGSLSIVVLVVVASFPTQVVVVCAPPSMFAEQDVTYRPRSASSLLILLRAILNGFLCGLMEGGRWESK